MNVVVTDFSNTLVATVASTNVITETYTSNVIVSASQGPPGPQGTKGDTGDTKVYIQETDPLVASPYIWFRLNGSGSVIDILKG